MPGPDCPRETIAVIAFWREMKSLLVFRGVVFIELGKGPEMHKSGVFHVFVNHQWDVAGSSDEDTNTSGEQY